MEILSECVELLYEYVVRGLFISVIWIFLIYKFFKPLDTRIAKNLIKYILLCVTALSVLMLLYSFIELPADGYERYAFMGRAFGPYWYAYWIMTIGSLSPLILVRKSEVSFGLLFLISVLVNIGWLFETYVYIMVALDMKVRGAYSLLPRVMNLLIRGSIVAVVLLVIGNLIHWRKGKMV